MTSEERMRKFMKKRMIAIAMIFAAGVIPMAVPVHASAPQTMGMELTMSGYQAVTADDNSTEADESTDLVVPGLGSWLYEKDDTNHILYLTKYTGKDERIRVPATYEVDGQKYAVQFKEDNMSCPSMTMGAFRENDVIKEVYIEDGVGGSFVGLFFGCRNLEKANIPNGVVDCTDMFFYCFNLAEAPEIPQSVTKCWGMFVGTKLTKAPKIPEGVTSCGIMFSGCQNLIEAPEIPNSVISCYDMFQNCTKLTKAPKIPEGVTDCSGMFDGCKSLTEAPEIPQSVINCSGMFRQTNIKAAPKIPKGVTNCSLMFDGCKSLTEAPEIPQSVIECNGMFQETSIKAAPKIPEGVTDCTFMFSGCKGLTETPKIPESVIKCGGMFKNCINLVKTSDIPEGVESAYAMFHGCSKLTGSIKIMGQIEDVGHGSGQDGPYSWTASGMFWDAATEGDGLVIQYAKGVNIDEILATKSETSKITAIQLPDEPAPTPDEPKPTPDEPRPTPDAPKPTPDNPTPDSPAPSGTKVATYNGDTFYKGDDGELRCYDSDGKLVTDEFKCDGTYTYYMQADGTPMKDRLTYHPDGEHIIYLDTDGHEVFTNFQYCPSVGYICYFDSQGYLYKDQITFVGDKTYYLNGNGALEQNGWFQFANGLDYGFANSDGTLVTTGFSYDPYGRVVFYHWNGMVARGLISDGVYYYSMDETDGHYLGQFPVQ